MEALQAPGDGVGGLAFSCQAGDVGAGGQGGGGGRRTGKLAALTVRLTIYLVFQGRALRDWDPTSVSLSGLALVQLTIGVLGVLVITSEYSTGSIQTSLAVVPRRGSRLAAGPPDVIASECIRATPACRAAVRGPMMPVWLAPTAGGVPAADMSNPDIDRI